MHSEPYIHRTVQPNVYTVDPAGCTEQHDDNDLVPDQ